MQINRQQHLKKCHRYFAILLCSTSCLMFTACSHSSGNSVPIITVCASESVNKKAQDALLPPVQQITLAEIRSIYKLSSAEVSKELKKSKRSIDVVANIRKALLLSRTQTPADSQKALSLLADITTQPVTPENESEIMLARVLHPIIEEQHKLHSTLTQQNKLLKENTQEIENLKSKLQALRAIEDSLSSRPPESDEQPANSTE